MDPIQSPKVLLDSIRTYGLSMQEVAQKTDISLAALYRIQHGAACTWKIQGKLWALLQRLEGRV